MSDAKVKASTDRDELRRRNVLALQLYSTVLIKSLKEFSDALDAKSEQGPPVTLAELNAGVKALGSEVRALGARGVKSLVGEPTEIEPAEQPPRLRLLKPTGKLKRA